MTLLFYKYGLITKQSDISYELFGLKKKIGYYKLKSEGVDPPIL